jgi:hypothetical protein
MMLDYIKLIQKERLLMLLKMSFGNSYSEFDF